MSGCASASRGGPVADAALAGREAQAAARRVGRDPGPGAAQQYDPVRAVRLGPAAHRQRPRVDPQRHHPDLGRHRRPSLDAG